MGWDGASISATIIQINKFGSVHLNISHATWDAAGLHFGALIEVQMASAEISIPFGRTFGDVPANAHLIVRDDYGRIEIATNVGDFAGTFGLRIGDPIGVRIQR